jgi:DNA-binding transcriptional LysR family regulator
MELYQLRYFLEVARQKNFTRAALRLHLAQAALSEQIRKLEAELGAALFHRGRRESTLTVAGQTLAEKAERLLTQADEAQWAIAEIAGLRRGRLSIASIPSVSACFLPSVISAFRKRYPHIELHLCEDTSEGVADRIETGRAEMGFLQLPLAARAFAIKPLLTERFVLLVPAKHAAARRKQVRLADFSDERFVFYKGRAKESALQGCRAAGFEPRVSCESGELETVRSLVCAGLGLAIVPQLAARALPSGVAALAIATPRIERRLAWVSRRKHKLSTAAAAFHDALQSAPRLFRHA